MLISVTALATGCAIPDTRTRATALNTDSPAASAGRGVPAEAAGDTAGRRPTGVGRSNGATKTGDPAAKGTGKKPAGGTPAAPASARAGGNSQDRAGRIVAAPAAPAANQAATPSNPSATSEPAAWAAPLRERPKPTAAAVLDRAPRRGSVDLVTLREVDGRPVVATVSVPDLAQARDMVDAALNDPGVLDVSVASTVRMQAIDPYRDAQWAMTKLSAEQVWSSQSGNSLTVAVLDTGVDAGHPDLAGVVIAGRDLVAGGSGQVDPNGHGTHVAGAIASVAGNGIGTVGLGQGLRIMPVRVLGADGAGTDADVANGVVWAVDRGARVINMSVGSPDYSAVEDAAIRYALQRDVVVVSAAGNARTQGNPVMYPSAFPGVIGVGASDTSDRPAAFSSTGTGVDLLAPGVGIVSTYRQNTYASMDGTSMSAPLVAATAALVLAAAPAATPDQVATILTRTARDLGTRGRDDASGYGLVQPLAALALADQVADGAVLPGVVVGPAAQSSLDVTSAPNRAAYRSLVSVAFRLTSAGRGLGGVTVSVCTAAAPSQSVNCTARRTDATGQVTLAVRAAGSLTVSARYAGSPRVDSTASRPVLVEVLPLVQVRAATRSVSATVNPVAGGTRVQLQQQKGASWRTVTTATLPSSGRVTFNRLTSGSVYRVAVPATDRTTAATSRAVRVR